MTRKTDSNYRVSNGLLSGALLASMLALTACGPTEQVGTSLVDVAQAAARAQDRVNAHDLATWIIEGRGDFVLVDVRQPDEYRNGAIEEAQNIPLAQLVADESLDSLPDDRMVVVYSNGSENAAKAVVLLRLSGINAHLLVGGYNAWNSKILNPDISAEAMDGESLKVSGQRAYACYFIGECSSAASAAAPAEPFVPPVFVESEAEDMPPPPAEEGC